MWGKPMEMRTALTIFTLETCPPMDVLEESYQNKKAQLAIKELKGEDITEERTDLELAYKTLVFEIQQTQPNSSESALTVTQGSQSTSGRQTSAQQNAQFGVPMVPVGYTGKFDHIQLPQTINCPHCGVENPLQASYCMICNQQISRPCPKCGAPVALYEYTCPRCQTVLKEYDQERFSESSKIKQEVEQTRSELNQHVQVNEAANDRYLGFGIVFWVITLLVMSGLCVLIVYLLSNRG
jgi:endogenous inhibitor of DNA gyrase (YacG/DUF329 family)